MSRKQLTKSRIRRYLFTQIKPLCATKTCTYPSAFPGVDPPGHPRGFDFLRKQKATKTLGYEAWNAWEVPLPQGQDDRYCKLLWDTLSWTPVAFLPFTLRLVQVWTANLTHTFLPTCDWAHFTRILSILYFLSLPSPFMHSCLYLVSSPHQIPICCYIILLFTYPFSFPLFCWLSIISFLFLPSIISVVLSSYLTSIICHYTWYQKSITR